MVSEEIRILLKARPFIPFRLHISDQAMHEVIHPDWALLNPAGTMMTVMDDAGYFHWVATAHVTRLSHIGEPQGMSAA